MSKRVISIDILRGLVMVLMAIDHVRVYAGMPAGGAEPAIFFTRWVTHFCVSGFVFFAGTGIFLHVQKLNDRLAVSRYLLIRGLILIILELTLIRFSWTFNFNYGLFTLAGVIWMLGFCMVLMALIIKLPLKLIGMAGLMLVFGQQVFSYLPDLFPPGMRMGVASVWNFFYPTSYHPEIGIAILYTIIPWIGVMCLGYWLGTVLQKPDQVRRKYCLLIGGIATLLFIVVGSIQILLYPDPENNLPFVLQLLHQNKYPASPLFLLMTLGPLIMAIPFVEKATGWLANILLVLGRAPLLYYLLHIPLIHLLALAVNYFKDGNVHQDWYQMAPFYTQQPPGKGWGLPLLYLIFVIVVLLLYAVCKVYVKYKSSHPENKWLRYL